MKNLLKLSASVFLVLVLLSSCSSVRVSSDYDTKTNFEKYKTYAFYKKGINAANLSEIDKKRILSAVEVQLKNKGFAKSKHPDLLVNIATDAEEHVEFRNLNGSFSRWPSTRRFTNGEITVELIDYADKKMVWQGTASGILNYLNTKETASNKEKQIKEFVYEIMTKYPPTAE
ncbi:MAG TPA: DUF4136 domain-containing protein [Flavobacteriia bacterium]|nr:DUF4136 domain-containing protein [Flavobacteriia bacterium]